MTVVFNIPLSRILVVLALMPILMVPAAAQDMSDPPPPAETTGTASTDDPDEVTGTLWERLKSLPWRPSMSGACGITGYGTFGRDSELLEHCRPQSFADETWQADEIKHLR